MRSGSMPLVYNKNNNNNKTTIYTTPYFINMSVKSLQVINTLFESREC